MKKLALALIGLTLVGSSAFAQTTGVLSRNAVGYVRATAYKGNFVFLTHNFKDINGAAVTVTNLIGNQVPNSSSVIFWDPLKPPSGGYVTETRIAGAWDPGTNNIIPGKGFWLRIPPTATSNEYQVYLMGEVPDKTTLPTNSQFVIPGFNMFGHPYPVSVSFTSLALAVSGRNTDSAIFWNNSPPFGYYTETRIAGSWDPGTNVVRPGQGFWYRSTRTTNTTWVQPKPYTWP